MITPFEFRPVLFAVFWKSGIALGAAMGALQFLTNMGLFIGQSPAFFAYMTQLARDADHVRRG